MKRALAAAISIAIFICSCITALAEDKYTYTAPSWMSQISSENGITTWVSSDYTSMLILALEPNTDELNIARIDEEDVSDPAEFMGDEIPEGMTVESSELTSFSGYECISIKCEMQLDDEEAAVFGKTYNYTLYIFASVDTIYMFTYGTSRGSSYSALDFETTFETFRINETLPAGSQNNCDPDLTLALDPNKADTEEPVDGTEPAGNGNNSDGETITAIKSDDKITEKNESFLESDLGKIIIIAGCVVIVCLIAIIIALAVRNKRKNAADDEPMPYQPPQYPQPQQQPQPPQNSYPQYQPPQAPPQNYYPQYQQQPPVSYYPPQPQQPAEEAEKPKPAPNNFWGDDE